MWDLPWAVPLMSQSTELNPWTRYTCDYRLPGVVGQGTTQGFTRKSSPQSWAVPGAVPWTSQSTKLNPWARYTSDYRVPELWDRDLPRDLQVKSSLQSWAVPGAVPWTSQSTNRRTLGKSLLTLGKGKPCIDCHIIML